MQANSCILDVFDIQRIPSLLACIFFGVIDIHFNGQSVLFKVKLWYQCYCAFENERMDLSANRTTEKHVKNLRNAENLDPTNKRLLELLSDNSRQSATTLGKALGLSRTAVQDRISKLEHAGVIGGYTTVVNLDKGGVEALLSIEILERPCLPALMYLKSIKGVVKVLSVAGPIDAVIWVRVSTTAALTQLVDQISDDARIGFVQSQIILNNL